MIQEQTAPEILPRSFVARIASHLNEISDMPPTVRSEWRFPLEQWPVGNTLNVPIDAEFVVPLVPRHPNFETMEADEIEREAFAYAKALITLRKATRFLQTYARKMRRRAIVEVERIRERGIDVRFTGVSFKETSADALASDDWKCAVLHVIAEVRVTICDYTGRREEQIICVEEPEHIGSALQHEVERQEASQKAWDELDRQGADLRVGKVCLDTIRATGVEVEEVFRTIGRGDRYYHTAEDGSLFFAGACDGTVEASLEMRNAYWNGRTLTLRRQEGPSDGTAMNPGPDVFRHPPFAEILQGAGITDSGSDPAPHIENPAEWLVDLESGRIWHEGCPSLNEETSADQRAETVLN